MTAPELPPALEEARRDLLTHPAVVELSEFRESKGRYYVDILLSVELPTRARDKGVSSTGVKDREWLRLYFHGYPRHAPLLSLREDFPSNLPHVNPLSPGARVRPCVFEGDDDELMHRFGFVRVIDQAVDWLHKAATNALIDLDQGWEPMRRDTREGTVRFDADRVVEMLPRDGSALPLKSFYVLDLEKEQVFCPFDELPSGTLKFSQKERDKLIMGETTTFFGIAADQAGERPVFSQYRPDTVIDLLSLMATATELGIDAVALREAISKWLDSSFSGADEGTWPWPNDLVAAVVLSAKRPAPLISAYRRDIEFIPYYVRLSKETGLRDIDALTVHRAAHIRTLTPELLARVSGYQDADTSQGWVLIGCGSVGSKLASHLGRAGFGNAVFIDNQVFDPHNAARNALVEESDFARNTKAEKLKKLFTDLSHARAKSIVRDAVDVLALDTPEHFADILPPNCRLVLDATASLTIGAAAAASTNLGMPQIGRYCRALLYGQGHAAVLALEGSARAPRCDDLQAELFALCRTDTRLRSAMSAGHADPTRVFVGDSCASFTMPMSDSAVSRGTSLMALQVEHWLASQLPSTGLLCIGTSGVADDDIGMSWQRFEVQPPTVLPVHEAGWEVRISARVVKAMTADAKRWGPKETGGALLGHVNFATQTIHIAGLVDAPPDSKRRRDKFELGVRGLQNALLEANQASIGYLRYLGTWHSHPMGGDFSDIDMSTLYRLAHYAAGLPMVSLVWAPEGLHCAIGRISGAALEKEHVA